MKPLGSLVLIRFQSESETLRAQHLSTSLPLTTAMVAFANGLVGCSIVCLPAPVESRSLAASHWLKTMSLLNDMLIYGPFPDIVSFNTALSALKRSRPILVRVDPLRCWSVGNHLNHLNSWVHLFGIGPLSERWWFLLVIL